jgi:phosphate-selective porin OprO/OprP
MNATLRLSAACLAMASLPGAAVCAQWSDLMPPTIALGSVGKISIGARIDGTVRTPTPEEGRDEAEFEWQTRRLRVEGTLFKRVEFELSHEFGDPSDPEHDEYLDVRLTRAVQIEAGQFKIPFSREALTGHTRRDFVHRSLAAHLIAPGHDVGVMAHGRLHGRLLSYEAGFFRGDGDNARTSQTRGGSDAIAARVVLSPLASKPRHLLAGLQIGAAAVRSSLDEQLGLRGRTVFGEGVFFDRVFVNGSRLRRGFEIAWARGPVSATSEYIDVSDQRRGMGLLGEDLPSIHSAGWYASATWLVTGERKQGRIDPKHSLFNGGAGAVELAVRVERLAFDSIAYPGAQFGFPNPESLGANAERVWTIGVTWYLNRYAKIQGNVVAEAVDDPQRSPAPGANGHFPSGVILFQVGL